MTWHLTGRAITELCYTCNRVWYQRLLQKVRG